MKLSVVAVLAALAPGLSAPAAPEPLRLAAGVQPPPPELGDTGLPTGRLQEIGANPAGVFFLDMDRTGVRRGETVEIWVLVTAVRPHPVARMEPKLAAEAGGRTFSFMLSHSIIDCASQTYQVQGDVYFSEDHEVVAWLGQRPEWRPAGSRTNVGYMAARLCAGAPTEGTIVFGADRALDYTRSRPASG